MAGEKVLGLRFENADERRQEFGRCVDWGFERRFERLYERLEKEGPDERPSRKRGCFAC